MKIKRFIDDFKSKYSSFNIALSAGYIDENGVICSQQKGAEDTFSIGMPVYDVNNKEIGRLSTGLWKNLNYSSECDIEIPVEHWRVDGYKGKAQKIKTYWQFKTIEQLTPDTNSGEEGRV